MTERFKPNTTVAAIIVWRDKFLLVQEMDRSKLVLNQPAGHIEAFESIESAAKREVKEETGLTVDFDYLQGTYYYYSDELRLHFLRFCYVVDLSDMYHQPPECQPLDNQIQQCTWLTYEQLSLRPREMRSPMVALCIQDYLAGKRLPLNAIATNLD